MPSSPLPDNSNQPTQDSSHGMRGEKEPHPVRILPLGDSITIGYPETYRFELFNHLSAADYQFSFVGSLNDNPAGYPGSWDMQHEGHSGWTTLDIDAQLHLWLDNYLPDITLIHLGTNDVTAILDGMLSMRQSEIAMRSIVQKLWNKNPQMKLYIAQILPFTEGSGLNFRRWNNLVDQWNITLETLAGRLTTEGKPLVLVDMNSGFRDDDFDDGVHPNRQGAEKMAGIWAKTLMNPETSV